jgi:hypothetical protein
METMKSLLNSLFLTIVSLFLISCTDGGSSSSSDAAQSGEYYFECKINGELKKFNASVFSLRYPSFEKREIDFGGYANTKTGMGDVSFNIQIGQYISGVTLSTGTYAFPGSPIIASYVIPKQNSVYSSVLQSFEIDISELNDNFVKGTFSGVLQDLNNNGGVISVTEGRFYAPHCKSNC